MNAYELRRALSDVPDDAEVFMAHQPAYPLQYDVGNVVVTTPGELEVMYNDELREWQVINADCDPQDDEFYVATDFGSYEAAEAKLNEIKQEFVPKVFIVEGNDQNYLRGDDCRAVGW